MFEGESLRIMPPDIMTDCCNIASDLLADLKYNNVGTEALFLVHLVNLSAIAIAEMRMDEDMFIKYCREQYQLYLEFQFDEIKKVGIEEGTA